jgi:hypothetical protein
MSNNQAPKLLVEIADKYLDGRRDAFWQHKQSNQWLIKHRDLEIAAGKAGIRFDAPTILEAKAGESVALVVTGRFGDATEWSIGEASPKNTQQAYPYAMAEKRAKDRVILKLFGIHGHAYADMEMLEQENAVAESLGAPVTTQKPDPRVEAARSWAVGYVEARADMTPAEQKELDEANSGPIARAAAYPAAKAVLEKAGMTV